MMGFNHDSVRLKSINHTTYNVRDKDKAVEFWQNVLGVKMIPSQIESKNIVWLQLPSGSMVHLAENSEGKSYPSHHGAFEVDNIQLAAERIHAKGVETTPIGTRMDGQRYFFLNDPDGNRIEICTKSGFGVLV